MKNIQKVWDDSPVKGMSQTIVNHKEVHGPFTTMEEARSKVQELIDIYHNSVTTTRWVPYGEISKGNISMHQSTKRSKSYKVAHAETISLSIEEKTISETPLT